MMQPADEPPPLAPCKLCRAPSVLRESHIVPRWAYKRAIKTGSGDPNLVMIKNDIARRGGRQLKEYMLCDLCEGRFERWEGYLARITIQEDDSFPALAQSTPLPEMSAPGLLVSDVSTLDLRAIERFAVSVIWRASESEEMPRVSLGPRYHGEVGKYLLDDAAGLPSFARLIVTFVDVAGGPRLDRVVIAPYSGQESGYYTHRFSLYGMVFNLLVGWRVPEAYDVIALAQTRRVVVTDGMQQIGNALTEQIQRVQANGGLRTGRKRK